jgi:hypothetical protein
VFLAGLIALVLIGTVCSATLGAKRGALVLLMLAIIASAISALSLSKEAVLFVVAYGGALVLVAGGLGLALGTLFRKK